MAVAIRLTPASSSPALASRIPLDRIGHEERHEAHAGGARENGRKAEGVYRAEAVRPPGWGVGAGARPVSMRRAGDHDQREHGGQDEGPAPAERDRHGREREPREQRALGAPACWRRTQPVPPSGHLPLEEGADRRPPKSVGHAAEQHQHGEACGRVGEQGHRETRADGEAGREPHAPRRSGPVDEPAGRHRAGGGHDVEERDGKAEARVAEGEVGLDPRGRLAARKPGITVATIRPVPVTSDRRLRRSSLPLSLVSALPAMTAGNGTGVARACS